MEAGGGVDRQLVMHNTFLIVGPRADPAGIRGMTSAKDAFRKIADTGASFVSRGDGSGTEAKELGYWKGLGITPAKAWYIQSGQGMAATLQIASEKGGYTLTDIATWAATRSALQLEDLVDGDPSLLNIYHVIAVNPATWPKVNAAGAKAFSDYVLSSAGQTLIGAFGQDTFGMQLFVPDAGKSESSLTAP
jgi:tungstate transport system substrate-binding protein